MQQAVLMLTYDLAAHGTEWAVEFIAERTEGKAVQAFDIISDPGPLVMILNAPQGDKGGKIIDVTPESQPIVPPQTERI